MRTALTVVGLVVVCAAGWKLGRVVGARSSLFEQPKKPDLFQRRYPGTPPDIGVHVGGD